MTLRPSLTLVLALAALLPALPAPAGAQPPPMAPRQHDPNESEASRAARRQAREQLKKEVLDQMRAMRMWKLTYELKLDQATAARVFPVLAEFDERARALGQERREIAKQLHLELRQAQDAASDKQPSAAKLRPLVDRLLTNQQKRSALDEERFKALRPALSPLQQAKLLLLLPRIDDDFRHRIREVMERRRGERSARDGQPLDPSFREPGSGPRQRPEPLRR